MNKAKLSTARELHAKGDLKGALEIYEALLKEDPKNAELLHIIGVLYAQLNQEDLALHFLKKALKIEPSAAIYNSLGNVLRRLRKSDEAIEAYHQAIALQSDYSAAYNNLGLMYYQQGKWDEAQKAYENALKFMPHFVDALLNFAILNAHFGRLDESQKQLEQALALNPENPKILEQLAQVHLNLGNYAEALRFFDEKLKTQPEEGNTFYHIGLCLLKTGQYSDAIKSFETALTLQTSAEDIYHHLATAYLTQDPEKSLNYYFRQLEKKPMMEAYYNIGVILMNKNRSKEAVTYLEQAASLEPDYFPAHVNLGALYLKLQNLAKAIAHYQMAARLQPEDAEIQHILAALEKNKTPDAAPKEYLQHLFDQYASFYETHLTQHLKYQVPEKLYTQVFEETGNEKAIWEVVDLGCGTGLCGALFRKMAKKLIGIDLSEKMLAIAEEKKIYDELSLLDVTAALEKYRNTDLILAADVFTYIGNLSSIFEKAYASLNENGLFAFSVEKTFTEPYELQHSIRYAHSKKYLEALITKNHFTILRFDNLILRKQHNKEVEGYLVLLKKSQ